AGLRRVYRPAGTQVGDRPGRRHVQAAGQDPDRALKTAEAPLPWWGLAAVLTRCSIGIMVAVLLSPLQVWLSLALGLAIAVVLIDRRLTMVAGLALAALLIGAGRGVLATTVELPPKLAGQNVSVSGIVDDDPIDRKASRRVTVRLDHLATGGTQAASNLRIEATVYGMTPVRYGDLVLLNGEIQQPPRFDQFDYRAYLAEQGIAGVMPSARLVRVTSHAGDPLHTALLALRHAVVEAVDRALPEPQAALLLGVVFGYRAALPLVLQQQMIASGLIHIVVISGQITTELMQTGVWGSVLIMMFAGCRALSPGFLWL